MNSDPFTMRLSDRWCRALRNNLSNVPIEITPQDDHTAPAIDGDSEWIWLALGNDSLYVGAAETAWRELAGWIDSGRTHDNEVGVPPPCQEVLSAAWNELTQGLGLATDGEPSTVTMPVEFEPVGLRSTMFSLTVPGASRILLASAFGDALIRDARKLSAPDVPAPNLAGLRLSLHVTLGRCGMQLKDVLRLTEGSIIELGKRAGDPIEIHINGRLLGDGFAAVCGDRYGIGVIGTGTGSPEELES